MFTISAFQHSMELNGLYVALRKKIEGEPAFFNVETAGEIILWQRTFCKGSDEEKKVWLISPVDKVGTDKAYACAPILDDDKLPTSWQEFDEANQTFHKREINVHTLPTDNWDELSEFQLTSHQRTCLMKYGDVRLCSNEFEQERKILPWGRSKRGPLINELTTSNLPYKCYDSLVFPLTEGLVNLSGHIDTMISPIKGSLILGSTDVFVLEEVFPKVVSDIIVGFFTSKDLMETFPPDLLMYETASGSRVRFDTMINMPPLKDLAETFFQKRHRLHGCAVNRRTTIQNGTLERKAEWKIEGLYSSFLNTASLKIDFFGLSAGYSFYEHSHSQPRHQPSWDWGSRTRCFTGNAVTINASGEMIPMKELQVGKYLQTGEGSISKVIHVQKDLIAAPYEVVHWQCLESYAILDLHSSGFITANHPIFDGTEKRWILPKKIASTEMRYVRFLYNVVLENRGSFYVNGLLCTTLGYVENIGETPESLLHLRNVTL